MDFLKSSIKESIAQLTYGYNKNKITIANFKFAIYMVISIWLFSFNAALVGRIKEYIFHTIFADDPIYLLIAGRITYLLYGAILFMGIGMQFIFFEFLIDNLFDRYYKIKRNYSLVIYFKHVNIKLDDLYKANIWKKQYKLLISIIAILLLVLEWFYFAGPVSGYTNAGHWQICFPGGQPIYQHIFILIFIFGTSFYMQFLIIIDLFHWLFRNTKLYCTNPEP